jgi:DMSO/TMAO reductase YedYZ molybdopterin-dependent catalytic subunit
MFFGGFVKVYKYDDCHKTIVSLEAKQTKHRILTTLMVIIVTVLLVSSAMTSVANAEWNMKVTDLAGNSITLTYSQLLAMPKTTESADLYCYGLLVTGGEWGGVKLSDILAQTDVDPTVNSIQFSAQDGYTITIPIDTAMQPDVIIAYEKDNTPLQETLRLVIPEANGNFWISMITSINMTALKANENLSANYIRTIGPPITPSPQPQAQPTSPPKSEPTIEPLAPLANATVHPPEQNTTKQYANSQEQVFPIELRYGAVIVVFIAVVAGGFIFYKRKNAQSSR